MEESLKPCQLFTPGPLSTTNLVRESMNYDFGSRDPQFIEIIRTVREKLLKICNVNKGEYEAILIQGSGTYGVEATFQSAVPRTAHKVAVVANGAYGERWIHLCEVMGLTHTFLRYTDDKIVNPDDVQKFLTENPDITHLAVIHSETTSGVINPIEKIGQVIEKINQNIVYIVDAMSSFGVYDIDLKKSQIDYIVSSPNKNLQGIPGFAFVIARTQHLKTTEYLYAQWKGLETNGQFRFTPPTHIIKAASVAIDEFIAEGGIAARFKRYNDNQKLLSKSMTDMGFKLYIPEETQGCIITTFLTPTHKNFNFQKMYDFLASQQLVIYPGKLTKAESFRIGSIGDVHKSDIEQVVATIKTWLIDNEIPIPVTY